MMNPDRIGSPQIETEIEGYDDNSSQGWHGDGEHEICICEDEVYHRHRYLGEESLVWSDALEEDDVIWSKHNDWTDFVDSTDERPLGRSLKLSDIFAKHLSRKEDRGELTTFVDLAFAHGSKSGKSGDAKEGETWGKSWKQSGKSEKLTGKPSSSPTSHPSSLQTPRPTWRPDHGGKSNKSSKSVSAKSSKPCKCFPTKSPTSKPTLAPTAAPQHNIAPKPTTQGPTT
jgi:hypothetical protein